MIDTRSESGQRLAGAYCNRGHGLTEKRELDAALSDLDESVLLDPGYACACNNRGRVYSFKRDYDRAIADHDKALQYDPSDVFSWNNRGQARLRLGDRQGAIADFRKALELRPGLPSAHDALQKLGALTREP
ncbi:tetratricopeptide repeat protein [Bradyrhizobium sp. Arg816]|uniref:tetratricopeptide repeat protein n=1 Tax=Bradyrhizobium sp. Arg816 TaxID=2998491 RepID=UPI00249D9BDE|nr:tetratricopeptide repeat protein [Bradyrhizobium sp. Arg816]MDI3559819.1 tetratricopeptide repeat protein [Bradyrhizobium sp. Arg816]